MKGPQTKLPRQPKPAGLVNADEVFIDPLEQGGRANGGWLSNQPEPLKDANATGEQD